MSGSKTRDELRVPEGWKLEADGYGRDASVVSTPSPSYFATVDWHERCFRSGMTTYGQRIAPREYKGAGWRQRLVDDAVAWLTKLMKTAPGAR